MVFVAFSNPRFSIFLKCHHHSPSPIIHHFCLSIPGPAQSSSVVTNNRSKWLPSSAWPTSGESYPSMIGFTTVLSANLKGWMWNLTMPSSVWIAAVVMAFSKSRLIVTTRKPLWSPNNPNPNKKAPQGVQVGDLWTRTRIQAGVVWKHKFVTGERKRSAVQQDAIPMPHAGHIRFVSDGWSAIAVFVILCDISLCKDPRVLIAWIGHFCSSMIA